MFSALLITCFASFSFAKSFAIFSSPRSKISNGSFLVLNSYCINLVSITLASFILFNSTAPNIFKLSGLVKNSDLRIAALFLLTISLEASIKLRLNKSFFLLSCVNSPCLLRTSENNFIPVPLADLYNSVANKDLTSLLYGFNNSSNLLNLVFSKKLFTSLTFELFLYLSASSIIVLLACNINDLASFMS